MGELVVSMSFRYEICSIRKRKGPQIDLRGQNFEVFVVFDAISVDFSKDFVLKSQSTQQRKNELCNVFFKRTLHVLLHKHFRMTPKESKNFNIVEKHSVQIVFVDSFYFSVSILNISMIPISFFVSFSKIWNFECSNLQLEAVFQNFKFVPNFRKLLNQKFANFRFTWRELYAECVSFNCC